MPMTPRRLTFEREKRSRSRTPARRSQRRRVTPQSASIARTSMRTGVLSGARNLKTKSWAWPLSSAPNKSYATSTSSAGGVATRSLLVPVEPLNITRDPTSINGRTSDMINVHGIRLDFICKNNIGERPMGVNIALISPNNATTYSSTDFFIQPGSGARTANFDLNRTYQDFMTLPINYDEYTVFSHDRFVLAPPDAPTSETLSNQENSYKHYQKYVPIRRQVRYDGSAGGTIIPKMLVVVWCDRFLTASTSAAVNSALSYEIQSTAYYKDVK